jgi:multidrug efflux pump subunit AcrB
VSRQLKYLLLISIALLSNLLLAFILYKAFKIDIHLYSMAGITISVGIMIDNSILVIDHLHHKKDMRIFLAVLGATLSTLGAVCIVFFLDEMQQVHLLDFAWVLIINLSISIVISLFLIPALMQKIRLKKSGLKRQASRKRKVVKWNRFLPAVHHFQYPAPSFANHSHIITFRFPCIFITGQNRKEKLLGQSL